MGNAAAQPISAKEFEKYGITNDDVRGFQKVVDEAKARRQSKKLQKEDLDVIHKYCIETKKKKRRGSKAGSTTSKGSTSKSSLNDRDLDELLSKQLSMMDIDPTSITEDMSGTYGSSRTDFLPSVINIDENHEEDFSVLGSPTVFEPRGESADC
jgi:hypothetical protein